jgi:sec-independent protein translocase protein TatC
VARTAPNLRNADPQVARTDPAASAPSRRRRRRKRDNPDAAMPLVEHLRELRTRLLISAVAIAIGTAIAWSMYDRLITLVNRPWADFQAQGAQRGVEVPDLVVTGIATPFTLQLQVTVVAGIILTCPIWLYELWAFVTPGLRRRERWWTIGFLAIAVPLFLAGMLLAFVFLPKALQVLIGFTPESFGNLITVNEYFTFVTRLLLVFGVAFLLPVFVVLLNLVGILTASALRRWWRGLVFGVFVFAAVATPTGDPWTLLALAAPMLVLLAFAFGICWLNDRRRRRRGETDAWDDDLDDDEASPLADPAVDPDPGRGATT